MAGTVESPAFRAVDIGHERCVAVTEPRSAFWVLVDKARAARASADPSLLAVYRYHVGHFAAELDRLRFGMFPAGVYLNPSGCCNLDCRYCRQPARQTAGGGHMPAATLTASLAALRDYFRSVMPAGRKPRAIFQGAEPLLNRAAVFAAIDGFADDFAFGLQTNGSLLDEEALAFLTARRVDIDLALDGPQAGVTDALRRPRGGGSVHDQVLRAIEALRGYPGLSVTTNCTTGNLPSLRELVELLHAHEVPTCTLRPVRAIHAEALAAKPADAAMAQAFFAALERTQALYRQSGRKLVIANFANVLIGLLAPTARRLMCNVSPCGGGRSFFALAANGNLYPCGAFIDQAHFNGGSLLGDGVEAALASPAFAQLRERDVDRFLPCSECAIRHFCGSPCPAEAFATSGGTARRGAYCEFYREQVRYALRLIADDRADDYLWDDWDAEMETWPVRVEGGGADDLP